MHREDHSRRRTAVARKSLRDHGDADMIFRASAILSGNNAPEDAELGQGLEALPWVFPGFVGDEGLRPNHVMACTDQPFLKAQLFAGQVPLRVKVESEAAVGFATPQLRLVHVKPPEVASCAHQPLIAAPAMSTGGECPSRRVVTGLSRPRRTATTIVAISPSGETA